LHKLETYNGFKLHPHLNTYNSNIKNIKWLTFCKQNTAARTSKLPDLISEKPFKCTYTYSFICNRVYKLLLFISYVYNFSDNKLKGVLSPYTLVKESNGKGHTVTALVK
jgi:hypothetical protein